MSPTRTVQTPVLEIAYEEIGPGQGFPVVLLHGFPDDVRAWDQVAPPHRLDGWEAASEHFLGRHLFDGDHFYFRDRLREVTGRIQDDVRRALLLAREPSPVTR